MALPTGRAWLLYRDLAESNPRPHWWSDEVLLTLSAEVVAASPEYFVAWQMRADVLSGRGLSQTNEPKPRTAVGARRPPGSRHRCWRPMWASRTSWQGEPAKLDKLRRKNVSR